MVSGFFPPVHKDQSISIKTVASGLHGKALAMGGCCSPQGAHTGAGFSIRSCGPWGSEGRAAPRGKHPSLEQSIPEGLAAPHGKDTLLEQSIPEGLVAPLGKGPVSEGLSNGKDPMLEQVESTRKEWQRQGVMNRPQALFPPLEGEKVGGSGMKEWG